MNNEAVLAHPTRRFFLGVSGLILAFAAGYGLYVLMQLVAYVARDSASQGDLWADYGLVAASLLMAAIAGTSLLWSSLAGRRNDVVPGPTLYLLGLFIAALSIQAALIAGVPLAWLGVVVGVAIIVAEYRSETI